MKRGLGNSNQDDTANIEITGYFDVFTSYCSLGKSNAFLHCLEPISYSYLFKVILSIHIGVQCHYWLSTEGIIIKASSIILDEVLWY